ncbi:MAG: PilZ domain-containing protein [Terracidiphilus sp.]
MKPLNQWFKGLTLPEPVRAERRQSPGLSAYHWTGSTPRQDDIRDISCTGVFLLTEERWNPGTVVSLTLQKKGPPEESPDRRVTLQARSVRWDKNGVGLSFVPPKDLDAGLWASLAATIPNELEPDDVLREFRMAEALAFLRRICPAASADARRMLCGGLSNLRALSGVEIALRARELVAARNDIEAMRAHPSVVVRILEDGSWADEGWIQQLWAGLLAASCTNDENDASNIYFVDLFSKLAATHVRALASACKGAKKFVSSDGSICAKPFVCTREEIIKITGWHDLVRIERDLAHMTDLGLLERNVKSASLAPLEDADISPSPLALRLFARCNGHQGSAQEFYGVVSMGAPALANSR